jgi:hypothetical protein
MIGICIFSILFCLVFFKIFISGVIILILVTLIIISINYLKKGLKENYWERIIGSIFMIVICVFSIFFCLFFSLNIIFDIMITIYFFYIIIFIFGASIRIGKTKSKIKVISGLIFILTLILIGNVLYYTFYTMSIDECGGGIRIEEKEPKLTSGNCMEFDYERNILVIGTEEGLGLFYLKNDTYQLIGNDRISSLAIDYEHDIYYVGTFYKGIKNYYVKNNTYIKTSEFKGHKYIRNLAYNEYNNSLLIGEKPERRFYNYYRMEKWVNDINSVFYDNENNLSFTYSQKFHLLNISNHNNGTNLTIKLPDNDVFDFFDIDELEIIYDSSFDVIFFGIKYDYLHKDLSGLVSYNLGTNVISNISLPRDKDQKTGNINDICLDKKHNELYIASNRLYIYNLSENSIRKIDKKNGFDSNKFRLLAIDYQNDILYIINYRSSVQYSSENTILYKYYLNNGTVEKVYQFFQNEI